MKTYERYKPSGVDFIETLPSHWNTLPLFTVLKERFEKNLDEKVTDVLSLSYGQIVLRDVSGNFGLLPESFSTYQIAYPNDIIIRPTDLQNDQRSLRVGKVKQKGIITSAYICLQPINIEPPFAYYLLHAYDLIKLYYKIGAGVRQTLKFEDLKRLPILIPTVKEQTAIAKYLDKKTSQIDKLIESKRRLIALLKEERSGVINKAVTRGISPHAKLRPSDIDWLGEIPEQWKLMKLKFLVSYTKGYAFKTDYFQTGGIPVIKASDIKNLTIRQGKDNLDPDVAEQFDRVKLKQGDIIVSTVGSTPDVINSAVGQIAKVPDKFDGAYLNQNTVKICSNNKESLSNDFLLFLLLSNPYRKYLDLHAHGTANQASLNIEDMLNFTIAFPIVSEQKQIVQFIETEIGKIDATVAKIEKEIEYLREYRTALISEVVTGKIDVREAEVNANDVSMRPSANPYFRRTVLGAEIVHQLHADHQSFGHTKLVKLLHLAEYHGRLPEIQSNYYRQSYGPYDKSLIQSIERQMEERKWYKVEGERGEQRFYLPLASAGEHQGYFQRYWNEYRDIIQWLIDLLKPLTPQQCEIISTLYAAWNDFLISGTIVSDNEIINEVLTNWRDEKLFIPEWKWRNALAWMRDKGLVPTGFGKPTRHSPPPSRKQR